MEAEGSEVTSTGSQRSQWSGMGIQASLAQSLQPLDYHKAAAKSHL